MAAKINWGYLIERFTKNTCTREELEQLLKLTEQDHQCHGLRDELKKHWDASKTECHDLAIDWEEKFYAMLNEMKRETPVISLHKSTNTVWLKRWAVAASILILVTTGGYLWFLSSKQQPSQISKLEQKSTESTHDIKPGGNKAVLILADGSVINLDSAKNGTLADEGNIKIIKGQDGQLLYHIDQESSSEVGYNTISTPRGGKYEVVLSDGTKVWLNAASSLKFPTSFKSKIRNVTLTGEGYFEVAKNKAKPFQVKVNDLTVEVLGTHFNINAYDDENSLSTTLLEGSVKVKKGLTANSVSQTVLLKPGEQANLAKNGNLRVSRGVNLGEAVAWKNDNFEFNDTPINDIMRQVSRWYDVQVDFRGTIPDQRLTGKISRDVDLSQLIEMLQFTGLNMKIENKKIIIWKN